MTRKKEPILKPLSDREKIYAETLLKTGVQTEAARAAGYASPADSGYELLTRPHVRAAIEEGRKVVQAKLSYGLEESMLEAEEAMKFARETENANAYVKAVELRSKLNGLLIERHDVRTVGYRLNIVGFGSAPPALPSVPAPPELPAPESEDEDDIWS